MSLVLDKMPLREPTPTGWLEVVMNDFPSFMQDHASCERKASANALSLVNKFPEFEALIEPMICLAKEELAHFHEVYHYSAEFFMGAATCRLLLGSAWTLTSF